MISAGGDGEITDDDGVDVILSGDVEGFCQGIRNSLIKFGLMINLNPSITIPTNKPFVNAYYASNLMVVLKLLNKLHLMFALTVKDMKVPLRATKNDILII